MELFAIGIHFFYLRMTIALEQVLMKIIVIFTKFVEGEPN